VIATHTNDGNCPECKALQTLEVTVVVKGDVAWGDVSCTKCGIWITDLMPDEMPAYGIDVEKEVGRLRGSGGASI